MRASSSTASSAASATRSPRRWQPASGATGGLGQLGGPSFNNLRVPYDLSIVAVTEQFGGHEVVVKRMTWQQLDEVASFLAAATKTNPYLARISDG